jgi:hypothetical protein
MFFGKVGLDGKPYAPYGPLAAVLAVPHHLAGRALASAMGIQRVPRAQGLAWVIFVAGVTMLATATAAALAVVGFHRTTLALGTPPRMALLLSLILGGASVLWPYGTSFFSEAFLAAAFIWAAAFLIEARTAANPARQIAFAALLIVVAGLTKVTSLIVAPAFVAAVLAERSIAMPRRLRVAGVIAGSILLAGVLQLGWNAYRFGSPFDLGYDWSETIPVLPARAFAITEVPRGLAVLLFSPGKSLFVWAPILVIALLNAAATWRRDRALSTGLVAAAAIGLLAYAAYLFPEGGYAGARLRLRRLRFRHGGDGDARVVPRRPGVAPRSNGQDGAELLRGDRPGAWPGEQPVSTGAHPVRHRHEDARLVELTQPRAGA